MKDYAPGIKSSELTLEEMPAAPKPANTGSAAPSVDVSPIVATAPAPVAAAETVVNSLRENADEFLAEAEKEYVEGYVDRPLWARALELSGGNQAQAMPAYLRARATALRVAKRPKRRERSPGSVHGEPARAALTGLPDATPPSEAGRFSVSRLLDGTIRGKHLALAAALVAVLIAGGMFIALQADNDAAAPLRTSSTSLARASTPPSSRAAARTGIIEAKASAAAAVEDFGGKVQTLKDAGNWNVLVLYAVEWTRKQPTNAEAWRVLSHGYFKLRQLDEALDTANKAVELGVGDFLNWQNLGQMNLALQHPTEARAAFEQAASLNDRDVVSLAQSGLLDLQLGRIADARTAFEKALAASPNDVDALCGAQVVAQKEGRLKDAEALTVQLKSIGGRCHDANSGESVRVVISSTQKTKGVMATGR